MSKEIENIERLMENKSAEFRDFKLTKIETRKDKEGEALEIEGIPITFNQREKMFEMGDWEYYEQIDKEALRDADMSDVIFNYNHGGRVYARTRNKSLELKEEKDGLKMKATLWADDPGHMELYRDIKRGNIDKMSFAFTVKEQEWGEDKESKQSTRTIKRIDKLFDVSAVDIPAYDATSISARRAFDSEREKREAESRKAESLAQEEKKLEQRKLDAKLKILKELI